MVGQIRSYISLMDENSPSDLINRIFVMINNLPNDSQKTALMNDYKNKKDMINRKRNKGTISEFDDIEEKKEEIDNSDEEINEKIKEYLEGKVYNQDIINKKEEIDIKISPYNLIRIGMQHCQLSKEVMMIHRKVPKIKNNYDHGIPPLPIYEEKQEKKIPDTFREGTYIGQDNLRWIFEKGIFYQVNNLNKILHKYSYTIENTILSLKDEKGDISLLKIMKVKTGIYKIFDNDKLLGEIKHVENDEKK